MAKEKTLFEIDLCGDCIYYGDCKKNAFLCPYSLTEEELKQRISEWYKNKVKKFIEKGEKVLKVR